MPVLATVHVSDILPRAPREGASVGRDGWQDCKLHKTSGKRPKWFIKFAVDVPDGDANKRVERRKYFGYCREVSRREAEELRNAFRGAINTPRREVIKNQILLTDFVQKYRQGFIPTLKPNSQASYVTYTNAIVQRFGNVRICDIKREAVQGWINEMSTTRTKRTCEYYLAVFSSVMDVATDWDYNEDRNPCKRVKVPAGKKSRVDLRALEPEEIRRLLSATDVILIHGVSLGGIIQVAVFCGLRIGEILALEWGDTSGGTVRVNKNRAQQTGETTEPKSKSGVRELPLGPVRLVRPAGARDSDRVFPLEYSQIWKPIRKVFRNVGISLQGTAFHALRRTFCTYFEAGGAMSLREQMGHSSESMSQKYVRKGFADAEAVVNRMAAFILGDAGGIKQ